MSDHTTLTDTERATLAAWWESDWPSDGADVLDTLAAVVESIVAARVAAARAERDRAWIGAVTLLLRAVTTNDATFDAVLPDMLAAARAEERATLVARLRDIIAAPDDEQWWPVQPYTDPANDDEVVEVQVINADRLRALIEGANGG